VGEWAAGEELPRTNDPPSKDPPFKIVPRDPPSKDPPSKVVLAEDEIEDEIEDEGGGRKTRRLKPLDSTVLSSALVEAVCSWSCTYDREHVVSM
jgi:hypothetical protein